MSLATYSDLQTEVSSWLHDTTSVITSSQIQTFIALGETRLNDSLRLRSMETTATLSLMAGANSVALPSGFLEPISIVYSDGYLIAQGARELVDAARNTSVGSGRPNFYAFAASTVDFDRTADTGYTLYLRYFKRWDLATDSTNTLMSTRPSAYLYSALMAAAQWRRDSELLSQMSALMNNEIAELSANDGRSRGSAPLRSDTALLGGGVYDIASDTWR